MPHFPGKYPEVAEENDIQGLVVLSLFDKKRWFNY